ncbi:MAG: 4-phosphoerythronate dehydrogenase [Bacteroidales bacterium]|nr:4-phosphoerythronate dehydrogenase [Bacteroidales bacterium]
MKIVCDDRIPFLRGVLEPFAEVVYAPGSAIDAALVRYADALIVRTRTRCDRALLEGSKVKVIASATIGYDHIDTAWCERGGIAWSNAPGCNSASVAQYLASVLALVPNPQELTLGIVGVGNVGSKVTKVASAFGMKTLLCDPPRAEREGCGGFVPLKEILEESDILTLHVPLTESTRQMINEKSLEQARKLRMLINTSRGEVVNGEALKKALLSGRLNAAVLDVWENEPFIDPALCSLCSIATPHIAGYSADGKAAGTTAAVRFVARTLGLPMQQWSVPDIPSPLKNTDLRIDCRGMQTAEIISRAVLYAYDVRSDSEALKKDLSRFEKLRGEYPVRREFGAFRLRLTGADAKIIEKLAALGFVI